MRVELLFWAGCPSHSAALQELRAAVADAGLEPQQIAVREMKSEDDAARQGFVGSPTIRIDGKDLQPPRDEPTGLTCRVYRLRDGRVSPTPDPADVRDALLERLASPTGGERRVIEPGSKAPAFSLPDTTGAEHGPAGAATVVCFTCNHCPYALAWHDRLIAVARDYAPRGVRVLAINPNDAERYPRDSVEAMRERVERGEFEGVPYLRDESQQVARGYDAKTTPDLFVLDADGVLRYRGAPDSDHADPAQDAQWLRAALDAMLEGRPPNPAETQPVGCSIKWRQS